MEPPLVVPSFIFKTYALILDIWVWGLEGFSQSKKTLQASTNGKRGVLAQSAPQKQTSGTLHRDWISQECLYHSSFPVALVASHKLSSLRILDAFWQLSQGIPTGKDVRVCFLVDVTMCCPMPWEHELLRGELKASRHMHQLLFIPPLCVSDLENCEEGWTKFQGHCYRHFEERETWMDAETRCRQHQAHLSSIITPEEQEFVNSEWSGQPKTGHGSNHWTLTLHADLSKVV